MKYLLQAAVLLLMLAVGISLRPGQIWNNWRRLTPSKWARLVAATFLLPPTLALALGNLFALGGPAPAGLFLIGAVPGAPLMTRSAARRGPARDGRLREACAGCERNAGDLSSPRRPGSAAIFDSLGRNRSL